MTFLIPPIGLFYDRSAPGLQAWLDFSAPVAQAFPETAVALATLLGDPTATPSYIWTCDEASGNLVDKISNLGLVPTSSPLQNRTASGLWDGSSYTAKKAVENLLAANEFQTNDSGVALAAGTTSVAYMIVFRCPSKSVGASSLLGKCSSASISKSHRMDLGGGTGKVTSRVGDSSSSVAVTSPDNAADGAWHVALMVVDRTLDINYVYTDMSGVQSASIAALGDISTTDPFGIGVGRFQSHAIQVAYVAAFEGAAAEAMDQTALDNFWTHASDPTTLLTTQTRASGISLQVSPTQVAHFGDDQLSIGYHAALSDTNKLGLYCNTAIKNITRYSEDLTSWINSTSTDAGNVGDAPDGFRSATEITASGSPGFMYYNCDTPTISVPYTMYIWIKRSGGSDVDGKIVLWDLNAATQTQQVYTATDTWQLISVTHTMGGAGAFARNYVYVDTSGEAVLAWGCCTIKGTKVGPYIRTLAGASVTLAKSDHRANGAYVNLPKGEIEVTCVPVLSTGVLRYLHDRDSAFADQRESHLGTNDKMAFSMRGGASVEDSISLTLQTESMAVELVTRYQWDVQASSLGYESIGISGVTTKNGQALPYEFTHTGTTGIAVGQNYAQNNQFDGFIQHIKSYEGPNV